MEPLKNLYSTAFLNNFAEQVKQVVPSLDAQEFVSQIFDQEWEQRELKQRMRHIATVLKTHLPGDFEQNVEAIRTIIEHLRKVGVKENSIEYMFFPDFVEQYGIDHPQTSLAAMEYITQFTSCEFAIRPFLLKYQEKVMEQMLQWSLHENLKVRRFSSEGCRPRLPWAMAIPALKRNPAPILPILENLKNDTSEFVRRSVANNLNDIAKDKPDIVLELVKRWKGQSKETDWIVKHGCRTLLRKANAETLSIFGLSTTLNCQVSSFSLQNERIRISDHLHFTFSILSNEKDLTRLRVEYAVYYVKANGKQSKKLFKITENSYASGKPYTFTRSQSFKNMTTRTHYPGQHKLAIVVNGVELASREFLVEE